MTIANGRTYIGPRFSVSFQRTLRMPDDGRDYPLPPGLGHFPVHRVEDYSQRVPATWREVGGVFIPMYQREALWLGFDGTPWKPNAVKIGVGGIDAITGGPWDEALRNDPQNYVVCPNQPWLDGIKAGEGHVRQFVAMPLGQGYTVEGQLSRSEVIGGFQIRVYEPRPGRFPDVPPDVRDSGPEMLFSGISRPPVEMGIAAGGKVTQKIYPDTYGIDTWDPDNYATLFVHLVNSEQYMEITGLEPPPTPISAQTYASYGLPWFGLYDEHMGDLSPSAELGRVKTIREIDAERCTEDPAEASLLINPRAVHNLHHGPPPARKDEPGGGSSDVQ